jgi:hypothetical protein
MPLGVPEQFALQQVGRKGGAVNGYEGLAVPAPQDMDGLGGQFLARAGLPLDQQRREETGCHGLDRGERLPQALAQADHGYSWRTFGREEPAAALRVDASHTGDKRFEPREVPSRERSLEIVGSAGPDELDGPVGRGKRCEHDHGCRRMAANLAEEGQGGLGRNGLANDD